MAEIFIEMQRNGAFLKCTAIDSVTGEEAIAIGPANDPESLKRLAVQKLRNKLGQTANKPRNGGGYGGSGSSGSGTDIKI